MLFSENYILDLDQMAQRPKKSREKGHAKNDMEIIRYAEAIFLNSTRVSYIKSKTLIDVRAASYEVVLKQHVALQHTHDQKCSLAFTGVQYSLRLLIRMSFSTNMI